MICSLVFSIKHNITLPFRAQKEIIIRLETLKSEQVSPSAPPLPVEDVVEKVPEASAACDGNKVWQDVKELLSITEGL